MIAFVAFQVCIVSMSYESVEQNFDMKSTWQAMQEQLAQMYARMEGMVSAIKGQTRVSKSPVSEENYGD